MAPTASALLLIVVTTTTLAVVLSPAPCMGQTDTLFSPGALRVGQSLTKDNYRFTMQPDCNLCLYDNNRFVWCTFSNGKGNNCRATMQSDGNLVVYSGTNAVWTSGSQTARGSFRLVLQSDRNVVIYNSANQAIWFTRTNVRAAGDTVTPDGGVAPDKKTP